MSKAWHQAAPLATKHPEQLLALLGELRSIPDDEKQYALDAVGEALAVAGHARPTLADCREALGASDAAPRVRRLWAAEPVTGKIDDTLIAFVFEAFGCAAPTLPARPPGADRSRWIAHSASSAEQVTTTAWRVEAANCVVEIERTENFFPGDVNEPPREWEHFAVRGARREPPASIRFHANVGNRDMTIDVDAPIEERDRILASAWRAFHWT